MLSVAILGVGHIGIHGEAYEQFREWLGEDDFDIARFDIDDMNFRLTKIPAIYQRIYEKRQPPSQKSIDLIERRY